MPNVFNARDLRGAWKVLKLTKDEFQADTKENRIQWLCVAFRSIFVPENMQWEDFLSRQKLAYELFWEAVKSGELSQKEHRVILDHIRPRNI